MTLCYNCLFVSLIVYIVCKFYKNKDFVVFVDRVLFSIYVFYAFMEYRKCLIDLCDF